MGHEEKTVVQHEIRWRHGQQHARHSADDEGNHEADRPQYRLGIDDATGKHREHPVEDLHARGHRDDHRSDAKERVDVGAGAHGEEVVQPHREGENANGHRRHDHRPVAEQGLARKRRNHLREDAERGQNENVDFGVSPRPDQVPEYHHVAAGFVGEEVKAEIPVQQQHGQRRREDGEGGDD